MPRASQISSTPCNCTMKELKQQNQIDAGKAVAACNCTMKELKLAFFHVNLNYVCVL